MSEPREDEDGAGARSQAAGGSAEQPPEGHRESGTDGAATGTKTICSTVFKRSQITEN